MVPNSVAQMAQTSNCAKANPGCVFPCFVGYKWLEDCARSIDPDRPVYVQLLQEPEREATSVFCRELFVVMVAQHDANGCIHYCRLVADELTTLDGIPCGDQEEIHQIKACARSLYLIVVGWLTRLNQEVIEGSYATPAGWQFREGQFSGARFDESKRRWLMAPDRKLAVTPDVRSTTRGADSLSAPDTRQEED